MKYYHGHSLPNYSQEDIDDKLFHYTNANGLMGIFKSNEIWCTASYCSNDETELATGEELLTHEFNSFTNKLINEKDPMMSIIASRGGNPYDYADGFTNLIVGLIFRKLCVYIACFCKPNNSDELNHGLLSQWRGYGSDGGYAIQFSRKKLVEKIAAANNVNTADYDLQEVHYTQQNPLQIEFLKNVEVFRNAYKDYLESTVNVTGSLDQSLIPNPLTHIKGRAFETLLEYLTHTKNKHFSEEKEFRLTQAEFISSNSSSTNVKYFNRNGLIVPYKSTDPAKLPILDCVEAVIVGPNPRMDARLRSATQMIEATGITCKVRPSLIPFVRH
ncbi:DUF2971 domain-containing protein [Ahrensia kielensis]|uniref:DUF2971 domain-containing protein n=1 Tax=Ahrensia kielensis TaxID=76980 RepID=UPI0003680718|nr:DUF2971 domain-containing protein [Ahrensia kielensis]